jgi:pre-mRNA-splicing factor ISY1
MKDIDAQYYGYRDDDDGLLVPLEVEAEREAIAEAVSKWREARYAINHSWSGFPSVTISTEKN